MYVRKFTVAITTNGSGAATAYTGDDGQGSSSAINGRVVSIAYTKTDFDNGVVFTITDEVTGQTIWTETAVDASKTVAPRQATHDTAGVASLYETGQAVEDNVYVAHERIKIVIASGGDTKTGSFVIHVES